MFCKQFYKFILCEIIHLEFIGHISTLLVIQMLFTATIVLTLC